MVRSNGESNSYSFSSLSMSKHVLVTGGNTGIGFALCKLLVTEHDCYVYLGSRTESKGKAAVANIVEKFPNTSDKIELILIDVSDDISVTMAAQNLRARGVLLYALVNNAGVGFKTAPDPASLASLMNVNYGGPKRVTAAFLDLIESRIVNVSSGSGPMWLRHQDATTKLLFSSADSTLEQIDSAVAKITPELLAGDEAGAPRGVYGLSKAALSANTLIQSRLYPNLVVVATTPGFIQTAITAGYGAKLTPEQGCVSPLKCLFSDDLTSGYFYGSDGLRSPWTVTRDPGMPEYGGEDNPDAAKYNK